VTISYWLGPIPPTPSRVTNDRIETPSEHVERSRIGRATQCSDLGPHDHHGIPVRQGEHNLDAGAIKAGHRANRIAPGIENMVGAQEFSYPGRVSNFAAGRIDQVKHITRDAVARIQSRQRNNQLLQPSTEQDRKQPAKRLELPGRLAPRIQVVNRRRRVGWLGCCSLGLRLIRCRAGGREHCPWFGVPGLRSLQGGGRSPCRFLWGCQLDLLARVRRRGLFFFHRPEPTSGLASQ
jgi:hypothetical protein